MELIAYAIGLFFREVFSLPAPLLGAGVALFLVGVIYRYAWNAAVDADWREDVAKADARRNARRK